MNRGVDNKGALRPAVLVTGGAGYIGSHTCKALGAAGYLPIAYDNLVHGHRWAVQWGPLVEGDVADAALVKRTLQAYSIQAVIHFAGYAYVGESMSQPGKYFRNNVASTVTLLEAMRETSICNIVFSSTCATYGMPTAIPLSEDHMQVPISPYGDSKLVVEKMLQWWGLAHGLRWIALRYFNAAGADPEGEIGEDHRPETHIIPLAIEAALGRRKHLDVYGTDYPTYDGTAIRDYIHVADLAAAHVSALRRLEQRGESGAFNVGTGVGHSVREVIAMVERVSGRAVPVREGPRRPGDPPELVALATRAHELLAWQPRHSDLEAIVRTAWQWHSTGQARIARESVSTPKHRAGLVRHDATARDGA
jgi:UDP-arabinose 4-epimerase